MTYNRNYILTSTIKNDHFTTDPLIIVESFHHRFTSVAESTQMKIKFANKSFKVFLKSNNYRSFVMTSTTTEEVTKTKIILIIVN